MAFRADEAERSGYERALSYLVSREISGDERIKSEECFSRLVTDWGPVVETYPIWHPLIAAHQDWRHSPTVPDVKCGYIGLDHTILLANAFITCPYDDGSDVLKSVEAMPANELASISASTIDCQFYHPSAQPILVTCEWLEMIEHMIPKHIAIPLLLERELPAWRHSQAGESWETMRSYFLGRPHGSRSSLFVNQETGQAMKNIWNSLLATEMFGPVKG